MVTLLGMNMGMAMLLIPNARDLDDLTKQFAKYKPVFFPAVNTLFNALANHKGFQNLTILVSRSHWVVACQYCLAQLRRGSA